MLLPLDAISEDRRPLHLKETLRHPRIEMLGTLQSVQELPVGRHAFEQRKELELRTIALPANDGQHWQCLTLLPFIIGGCH